MPRFCSRLMLSLAVVLGVSVGSAQERSDLMDEPECQGRAPVEYIKFATDFFQEIHERKKVATTRKGVRCYAAGSVIEMQSPDGTLHGVVKIVRVTKLNFDLLTEEHANLENCTLKELQEGLLEIYGPEIKEGPISFVEFVLP